MSTSRWETNVLVITSSVRMLDWILGHTSDLWPAVTLDTVLVVGTPCLEERLIGTSTSSDDSDLRTNSRGDSLLASGRKTKTGSAILVIVCHNDSKGTRSTGKGTTVA
jgi:hypothetical protein